MTSRIEVAPFFVVRSPLLSYDGVNFALPGEDAEAAAKRHLADPAIREAVTLASPSLMRALEEGRPDDVRASAIAVLRYVERMRGRSTPFQLMAGYAIGKTGSEATEISFVGRDDYRRIIRLDVEVVRQIVMRARTSSPEARARGRWLAKRDLLFLPDIVRMTQRTLSGDVAYHDIVRSPALESVLEAARGPKTLDELVAILTEAGKTAHGARKFIDQLIDSEILIPAEYPAALTDDELAYLESFDRVEPWVQRAREIRDTSFGSDVSAALGEIREQLQVLVPDVDKPFVYDLKKPTMRCSIGAPEVTELKMLARLLARLAFTGADSRLRTFAKEFGRRYEHRWVRLVDALDEERGYDFPAEGEVERSEDADVAAHSARINRLLFRLYDRAARAQSSEVELLDEDLESFATSPELPSSFAIWCRMLRVEDGGPIQIHAPVLITAPGTLLFARATALDPVLRDDTRALLERAAALESDIDIADLSYFVPGRVAAFSQYPALAKTEVTLTPRAAGGQTHTLDVNDLLVGCMGTRFVLRSARTGRMIAVRPTSAANLARTDTTSLIRFLSALSRQDVAGHSWNWDMFTRAPALPRVRYKRHILSPGTWNLSDAIIKRLKSEPRSARRAAVDALRKELHLPRWIAFHERHDHLLPVDLECPVSVDVWLDTVKGQAAISEVPPPSGSVVRGPEGAFAHEVVVPFLGEEKSGESPRSRSAKSKDAPLNPSERDLVLPGGPYLYITFHGSRPDLVPILTELVEEVLDPLKGEGAVEQYFFLPFHDERFHIRLRAKGDPTALRDRALAAIMERLACHLDSGLISDAAVAAYDRETYRYGGPVGMNLTERVWSASSRIALAHHREADPLELEDEDFVHALTRSHMTLLQSAGLSPKERAAVAAKAFAGYSRAKDPMPLRRSGASLFRSLRSRLGSDPPTGDEELARIFSEIHTEAQAGRIRRTLVDMLPDYLHTHSFRMLAPWHSLTGAEALSYVVLEKVYASDAALKRGQ